METKLCNVVILIVCFLLDQNDAENVVGVDTYRNFLGAGRFRVVTTTEKYNEAIRVCKSEDAHLAVPTSKAIQDAMVELLRLANVGQALVGVNDIKEEGKMVTVNGELYSDVGYAPWMFGEPNDSHGEDCAAIDWNGLLNDINCQDRYHEFICEKDRLLPHNPF